jgi:uncharacterized protein
VQSTALVATDRAERYAKQLVSHLGRHDNHAVDEAGADVLTFTSGSCTVAAAPEGVLLHAQAADAAGLAQVQDIIARHLVRFGEKDDVTVTWS